MCSRQAHIKFTSRLEARTFTVALERRKNVHHSSCQFYQVQHCPPTVRPRVCPIPLTALLRQGQVKLERCICRLKTHLGTIVLLAGMMLLLDSKAWLILTFSTVAMWWIETMVRTLSRTQFHLQGISLFQLE